MFDNILGHENEKKFLASSIINSTYSHAYLFYGSPGIGKCLVAKEFARQILKVDNIYASPDFVYIKKEDDKKNIVVDQIRESIIDNIHIAPFCGEKKVYLIDDGEFLNEAAQNAILKTLEEPPSFVVIIIVTSSISTLLPTVMSRLNKIKFSNLEKESVNKHIYEKFGLELSGKVLEYIDGSIGDAVYIVQNNTIVSFKNIDEVYKNILEKEAVSAFLKCDLVDFTAKHMLDYLQYLFFLDNKYLCVEIIEKTKERLKYNANYDILIDNMILKCIESI